MEFKDLVKEYERTGGKVKRNSPGNYGPEHMKQANAILEYIKEDILTRAGEHTLARGETVTLPIPDAYLYGFAVSQNHKQKSYGNLLGNLREVTARTFVVGNVARVVSVFSAAKSVAAPEGITLGDPFILGTVYKYTDEDFDDEEIAEYKKYPIRKKKLRADLKTSIRRNRLFWGMPYKPWHGEKGALNLAVEYTYKD